VSNRFRKAGARAPAALLRLAAAALLVASLGACSSLGVKPWDRDLMARPDMAPDPAPIDSSIDDHIYFSKEAATGGRGFGGGGCGCN
jgi:hypothetical protein